MYGTTELKELFGLASEFVEDLTIGIDNECLFFRTMDPSHVCLVDLVLPNTCFEKWEVKSTGSFAVRTKEIYKLFKTLDKKDSVTLKLDDNLLYVSTRSTSSSIRLLEVSSTDCPLPKISYNALIGIELKSFKNAIKRISLVSEYVNLKALNRNIFVVSGKGDQGESKLTFERGQQELPELEVKEISESTYSIEYISQFLKHVTSSFVTIEYSQRMPLRLEAKPMNGSRVYFYLTPRVEN